MSLHGLLSSKWISINTTKSQHRDIYNTMGGMHWIQTLFRQQRFSYDQTLLRPKMVCFKLVLKVMSMNSMTSTASISIWLKPVAMKWYLFDVYSVLKQDMLKGPFTIYSQSWEIMVVQKMYSFHSWVSSYIQLVNNSSTWSLWKVSSLSNKEKMIRQVV